MNQLPAFAEELARCIQHLHAHGHSPATSTNYSFIDENGLCWVSRSGIDKSTCVASDFILINRSGQTLPPYEHVTPSAETGIHCALYELFPTTKVILHSHDVYPVLAAHGKISLKFEGFELQKGFPGVTNHHGIVEIPVVPNSQDMTDIQRSLHERVKELSFNVFMIEKHGFYAWGSSLAEAKRVLESFSYLCKATYFLSK